MKIDQSISVSKISPLENAGLLDFMSEHGIPAEVCQKYLMQIKLYNARSKKHFMALGMLNEDEGYELQNQYYSGWIDSERDISVIRGSRYFAPYLHVFLHMNDFLTMVAREKGYSFVGDALILHTYDLLHKIPPYLTQYPYKTVYSWLPNNDYGQTGIDTLSAYCLVERGLEHQPMNRFFAEHETIHAWCIQQQMTDKV